MSPARVQPSDEVIFQALHDELVLLNLSSQEYFGLNDVGAVMWKLLAEHGDVETVADLMVAEYDVDRSTARRDLGVLVDRLLAAGLLRDAGAGIGSRNTPAIQP